jgi:hypothetical protein
MVHMPDMYGESGPFGICLSPVPGKTCLLFLCGEFRGQPFHTREMSLLPVPGELKTKKTQRPFSGPPKSFEKILSIEHARNVKHQSLYLARFLASSLAI